MKLVIAQSNLTLKGGAERVLLKIAQRYDAKIYTAEYDPKATFPEFSKLDVEVIGKKGVGDLLPYGRVMQGLKYGLAFYNLRLRNDYDVINAHMAPAHWIRNRNERVLWYCHTPLRDIYDLYRFRMTLKTPLQRPVYRVGASIVRSMDQKVVKRIELIVANSSNTQARISRYFGRSAQVINGGIDYEDYSNRGDGKYFLYPSRISPNKRQLFAIDAFRLFRRVAALRNYRLIIAGPVSMDPFYRKYYDEVVARAGKVPGVKILTDVQERQLKELYSKATAVLYPPINEDYGLVPLEGMASGKPVIANDEGGPRETVLDGKTGFLVGDEKGMAAKMRYVAEHPSIAEDMGRRGMARVRKHYSWSAFFRSFDRSLRKVKKE